MFKLYKNSSTRKINEQADYILTYGYSINNADTKYPPPPPPPARFGIN